MKTDIVRLPAGVSGFAEDKDEAKRIRVANILPIFAKKGDSIILDFIDIKYSTQSFIHALLGEVLQRYRESALEKIEFKNCAPQVKSLVRLVVDYSLGGFSTQNEPPPPAGLKSVASRPRAVKRRSKKK